MFRMPNVSDYITCGLISLWTRLCDRMNLSADAVYLYSQPPAWINAAGCFSYQAALRNAEVSAQVQLHFLMICLSVFV